MRPRLPAACAVASASAICTAYVKRLPELQTLAAHQLAQRAACHPFHRDEGDPAGIDIVDRDDVEMIERRGGLGPLNEAPAALGVRHGFSRQDLHGHRAIQPSVNSLVTRRRTCRTRHRDAAPWRADRPDRAPNTSCYACPRMILLLRDRATSDQIAQMLADWEVLVKVVVDIRRGVLAGGGEMHADAEALLLADGSQQEDLWGANWYPASREIRFEALINIRPRQSNRRMQVESEATRDKMEAIIRRLLEGRT